MCRNDEFRLTALVVILALASAVSSLAQAPTGDNARRVVALAPLSAA
jgi:hypothetical protein